MSLCHITLEIFTRTQKPTDYLRKPERKMNLSSYSNYQISKSDSGIGCKDFKNSPFEPWFPLRRQAT